MRATDGRHRGTGNDVHLGEAKKRFNRLFWTKITELSYHFTCGRGHYSFSLFLLPIVLFVYL